MNLQIYQAIVNTVGISFTMIGAILIAVDVTRQYKSHPNEPIVQQDPESEDPNDVGIILHPSKTNEYSNWERTNRRLMIWGLLALLKGGVLQIWATWIM